MQYLDVQVVEQSLRWLQQGEHVWLCTVLATFGSSPRSPGALLTAEANGEHVGSLSGGCVEEDFLERLSDGEFNSKVSRLRYGEKTQTETPNVSLPCGGILDILIEKLLPDASTIDHMQGLLAALKGHKFLIRQVDVTNGKKYLKIDDEATGPCIAITENKVCIRVGPAAKLIIAGMSPVSAACANFAVTLGFEVIICDPRANAFDHLNIAGVVTLNILPSLFIESTGACHSGTAIVALTHDPRIDDLAMMDAVKTNAFYIGVMGSQRTSRARAERLHKSGGLSEEQIACIHMPIGLALGSKTPSEIALAVIADVVRVLRGKLRTEL